MTTPRPFRLAALILSASAAPLAAQRPASRAVADSVRQFVQVFYNWYSPDPNYFRVLAERPSVLSRPLLEALRADSAASARSPGEIVGLDWDPFVNSQDPCPHYEAGKVTEWRGTYRVELFGTCSGPSREKPDVIAELSRLGGGWRFVNIRDARGEADLLGSLRTLARERAKGRHSP